MSLTEHKDESATLSSARLAVCLQCAWELDALASHLPNMVPMVDDDKGAHFAVRGIAGRIQQLASVLMSGLGDSLAATDDLARTLNVSN